MESVLRTSSITYGAGPKVALLRMESFCCFLFASSSKSSDFSWTAQCLGLKFRVRPVTPKGKLRPCVTTAPDKAGAELFLLVILAELLPVCFS